MRAVFEAPTVAELAVRLEAADGDWTRTAVMVADRSLPLALSYQQERFWFLDRLDASAGAAYHIEGALRLQGALDAAALHSALTRVVGRHDSLRTTFAAGGLACRTLRFGGRSAVPSAAYPCR